MPDICAIGPRMRWAAVAIAVCVCLSGCLNEQRRSVQAEGLDPRIGEPNQQQYDSIIDAKDWKNPILVIRREGIELIAKAITSGDRIVAVTDLAEVLRELPVSAWPYGRVVVLQEIGIRTGDVNEERMITANHEQALVILKKLGATVQEWPSA